MTKVVVLLVLSAFGVIGAPAPRRELGEDKVVWYLWDSAGDHTMADLFDASYSDGVFNFANTFSDTIKALGSQQSFTWHAVIEDGASGSFAAADCTNNGRYCAYDPDSDPNHGLSGADIVAENLRRLCIQNMAGSVEKWWEYVSAFKANCNTNERFGDASCYEHAMDAAGVSPSLITQCINDMGGLGGGDDPDANNDLLDIALDLMKAATPEVTATTIRIGSVDAGAPFTRASVLADICARFDAEQKPGVCACAARGGDDAAYNACVKSYTASGGGGGGGGGGGKEPPAQGVQVWVLVVVIISVIAAMLLAGFVYWKRTQQQMRDQVRGILAEYMPLDDDGVPGSSTTAQFNIQSDGGALV